MGRRAFSLVETLVVVAILALLAALLFPVFAQAKARAKLTDCGTRLHGFAAALNLYRADHDDRGFAYAENGGDWKTPYGPFEGMQGYLKSPQMVSCKEPAGDGRVEMVVYRAFKYPIKDLPYRYTFVPAKPDPTAVVAYCGNHTHGPLDPLYGTLLREGDYPFVREDASMGVAKSASLKPAYYGAEGWADKPDPSRRSMLRFPGEPWPPTPER